MKKKLQTNSGLTFVELIVVMSIFSLLSGVVLFNFNDFGSNITLQNLSQDIALQVRQAQVDSLSGRGSGQASFGVYFSTTGVYPTRFIYFFDSAPGDKLYGSSSSGATSPCLVSGEPTECINAVDINGGYRVSTISLNNKSSGIGGCSSMQDVNNISIVFKRPDSSPSLRSAGIPPSYVACDAQIKIRSPRGAQKIITIGSLGQIAVE